MKSQMRRTQPSDEGGFVAGFEGVFFGILVFAIGALLMVNAWAVVDAKFAVQSAARESARYLVESDGDVGQAAAAGRAAFIASGSGQVANLSAPDISIPGGFARCNRVTVTYEYKVPAIQLPFSGSFGSLNVSGSHSEIIDPYRSGLQGEAQC